MKKIKNKSTLLITFSLCMYTIIYILISHSITDTAMNSLRALNGVALTQSDIKKKLHKSTHELKNKKEITFFSNYMNITIPENSVLYKVTGKGLPYYYGAIVLDTLHNKVLNVAIKELQ